MPEPESVTDESFAKQVVQSAEPFLLEFTSPMCAPCKALEPVLRELLDEWSGMVRVGQLDVSVDSGTPSQLGVRSTPTLILFDHGVPVRRIIGARNKRNLIEALRDHLPQ